MRRSTWMGSACLAIFVSGTFTSAAIATEADAAPGAAAQLSDVVVTASRIVRDGYEAPTPTTVISAADIDKQSVANLADYINTLPQLGAALSPRSTSFLDQGGVNTFNLRNLEPDRTLTLLDGRRVVGSQLGGGSGSAGTVDINLLPLNLVSRVDIVTGGASAAWGSDAVAGVVNLVLDKQFEGLKGSLAYGESWQGDAADTNGDLAFGTKFAGGRGHLLLSGRLERSGDMVLNSSRDWYTGYKAVPNPAYTPTNGQPGLLGLNNAGLAGLTTGGVGFIPSPFGPPSFVQFGPGGAVLPYRYPTVTTPGSLVGAGGDAQDIAGMQSMLPEFRNESLFARVSYDLTDHVNGYVEIGAGWDYAETLSSPNFSLSEITADNPFIPAGLNLNGQLGFLLGRVDEEPALGPIQVDTDRHQQRYVVGLDGDVDWFNNSFKWHAYYQHGENTIDDSYSHNLILANYALATDVVSNPAVGGIPGIAAGVPVCRSTITAPTNGCQPLNPFGEGSPSPQALAYVAGASTSDLVMKQDVASAAFQFEPFSVPAGPVSIASGAEWRKEQYHQTVDALDASTAGNPYFFGNFKAGDGAYNVKEVFGETIVPILKDLPLVKSLDFNGAARETDYSTSGSVTTWKAGVTWDVIDDLRFRATRSRDIRAPNLSELYGPHGAVPIQVFVPGTAQTVQVLQDQGGIPNLVPEKADTTSFGVVFRPSWFSGFSASLDYYKININKAIVALPSQQIVDLCYGANGNPVTPSACGSIEYNPNPPTPDLTGKLTGAVIEDGAINIGQLAVAGYDFNATYRRDLSQIYAPLLGSIELRADGSYVSKYSETVAGVTNNYRDMVSNLGQAGGPNWRWLFTGSYSLGRSTTTATVRYVGEMVVNNEPIGNPLAIYPNNVNSVTYLALGEAWNFDLGGAQGQVFAKIDNVFDTNPPKLAITEQTSYVSPGTDFGYYDAIGRAWRVGVRFKY